MNNKNDNQTPKMLFRVLEDDHYYLYMEDNAIWVEYGDQPPRPLGFTWKEDQGKLCYIDLSGGHVWNTDTDKAQVAYTEWKERCLLQMIVE